MEMIDTWIRYKETGDQKARDDLIVHYKPLLGFVAGRMIGSLPPMIDRGDLVGYGTFGLIDAIGKFDLSRNIKFETYAVMRIKGAILDELRSLDWVPRSVRSKTRSAERAHSELEGILGRSPTQGELAYHLDVTIEELQEIASHGPMANVEALDELISSETESPSLGETIADRDTGTLPLFEIEEMKQILSDAIEILIEREKIVLTLYYYEGLTLEDIGHVLGVTESRVCQIHTKAVLELRSTMVAEQVWDLRGDE